MVLKMDCPGQCLMELGPPPDMILRMPPPPLPSFMQGMKSISIMLGSNFSGSNPPCKAAGLCSSLPAPGASPDTLFPGVEYVELSRHDSVSGDDTWFLVLVASCAAVLFLGAVLALFLLKCRETYTFHFSDTNANKQVPPISSADLTGALQGKARSAPPLGPYVPPHPDNRALWAALTPRGTQHFITDIYPQDLVATDMYPEDNHYETVEAMNYKAAMQERYNYPSQITTFEKKKDKSSFDNSGFVDYEYEDPAPLIESYQMDEMETCYQEPDINPYCIINQLNHGEFTSMKRGSSRPRVSSPTRIDNPNLPPLNLYPHRGNGTLRKPSHSRRVSDTNSYSSNINI